ncbi:hypothetical protein [Streptomyces candidus]|uniref:WD40 repeat domain-containing protein n=1 Tax=Streptomyces candidus TaxID=67283 RepID=A0A7X0LPT2_9ACTN|nr:hypothetical protein [Streptomyces candidus]MBB6435196.1 hypothetical protein [Streptomyces candidus]GHH40497.1 hypothetical protein GCM10018773_21690 [Streptomyces candidus]
MKFDQATPATSEESAPQVPPSNGSNKREQRPSRRGAYVAAGIVAAVVAAAAIAVTLTMGGNGEQGQQSSAKSAGPDVTARPDQSPPRDLIAAGKIALSAYHTTKDVKQPNGDVIRTYNWRLLNTNTGRYEETDWAWLSVAPGMQTAAVLERGLPAKRVGLLSLATGKVTRWIDVDKGVGGVQFSPDGKKLLATAYGLNPDRMFMDTPQQVNGKKQPGPKASRTGFYAIDVATGKADFADRPADKTAVLMPGGGRKDFRWSHDSKLLWEYRTDNPGRIFYTLKGSETQAPKAEAHLDYAEAGLSPDGNLVAGSFAGKKGQIISEVLDARTGKRAALVPGQQLLAWADDKHLVAWSCDPEQCDPGRGEFRNQLILVGPEDETVTPLSGFREAKLHYDGRWNPVFTRR